MNRLTVVRRLRAAALLRQAGRAYCWRTNGSLALAFGGPGAGRSSAARCWLKRGACLAGVLATVKSYFYNPDANVERQRIADMVRQAVSALRKGQPDVSVDLLHRALGEAEVMNDQQAINYIYDLLANVYYESMDLDRAKALFLSLTERLVGSGMAKTDPAIVEISLKLADIYAMQGEDELAEAGFKFCIDTQKAVVQRLEKEFDRRWLKTEHALRSEGASEADELTDPVALYGMILETYGRYLMQRGRAEESQKHFCRALQLARDIYSPISPQVIVMMNNYGIECLKQRRFDLAVTFYAEVVYRAVHCPELVDQLPAFYCNYAEALWHVGKRKEALEMAEKALAIVESGGDKQVAKHVRDFLKTMEKDCKGKK